MCPSPSARDRSTMRCSVSSSSKAHIDWAARTSRRATPRGAARKPRRSRRCNRRGRYALHAGPPAQGSRPPRSRGSAAAPRHALVPVAELPRGQRVELEREHDHRPLRDSAQLGQSPSPASPSGGSLRTPSRRRTLVVEWQRLGPRLDRRRCVRGSLSAHRGARLGRQYPAIQRLIGAAPCADVQNRARIAERRMDAGVDARVGSAVLRIGATVTLVVDASLHSRTYRDRLQGARLG